MSAWERGKSILPHEPSVRADKPNPLPPSLFPSFLPPFLLTLVHPFLQKQPNRIRPVKVLPVNEWEDDCDNTSLLWTVVLQIITTDQYA